MGQFSNGSFKLEVDQSLLRRRRDFQGMPLTVAFTASKIDQEPNPVIGYYSDLATELSQSLNFTMDLKPLDTSTVDYGLLLVRKQGSL